MVSALLRRLPGCRFTPTSTHRDHDCFETIANTWRCNELDVESEKRGSGERQEAMWPRTGSSECMVLISDVFTIQLHRIRAEVGGVEGFIQVFSRRLETFPNA